MAYRVSFVDDRNIDAEYVQSILIDWAQERQDWFDAFAANALMRALCSTGDSDDLEAMYPGSWIYLNMIEE